MASGKTKLLSWQDRAARRQWTAYGLGAFSGLVLALLVVELRERQSPDLRLYRTVRDLVAREFVEELDSDELVDRALGGMLRSLDEYSDYYEPDELQRLNRLTTGTFTGIGVVFKAPTDEFRVLFPTPRSPSIGKIRVGDRLLSIDGNLLAELEPGELQERVQNSDGREVLFEIEGRDGERRVESITPAQVVDPTVKHARLIDQELGLCYLAITAFSSETAGEFDSAIEVLRGLGMRALIIDLRDNPGGVLDAAVAIANRFIERGTIVSTRSRDDSRAYTAEPERASLLGLPLALLVDGGSASASEVLTGAIQDYRLGAVVGMPTYGKGLVQSLQPFGDRAAVKITTALYTTPANRQIDRAYSSECAVGLDPDLAVPISRSERRAIHAQLARFSPPHDLLTDIERWENEEHLELLPEWPQDAQLHAAMALFAGKLERQAL